MTGATAWRPPPKGGPLGVDWCKALSQACGVFDPYLIWRDISRDVKHLPVVVELHDEFCEAALHHLNDLGLRITPHYIDWKLPNGHAPRFVTGACRGVGGAGTLFESLAAGPDAFVARYELSAGFRNPDYYPSVETRQIWKPEASFDPCPGNVVGFIDYGCAFLNHKFTGADGNGRVERIWNQARDDSRGPSGQRGRKPLDWRVTSRFEQGKVADRCAISDFARQYADGAGIDELACYRDAQYEPIRRQATHGTFIMDVATGWPNPLAAHRSGARHEHPIVFVQLPRHLGDHQVSGLLRAQVLDAMHFIALHVGEGKRAVVNLSYGSYCGPHDGSSIVERALDELLAGHEERLALVIAAGNALDQGVHAQAYVRSNETEGLVWENSPDDPSDSFVELWWPEDSQLRVRVTAPDGTSSQWLGPDEVTVLERRGRAAAMLCTSAQPCQAETGSMALLAVSPTAFGAAPYGRWRIEVGNGCRDSVLVDAWCERDDPVFGNEAGPRQARFVDHVEPTGTLNAIAHGRYSTVVGAYVVHDTSSSNNDGPVAPMSGTGPGRGLQGRNRHAGQPGLPGPQVLAPGDSGLLDGIAASAVLSGDAVRLAGTSVAAARYTRAYIDGGENGEFSEPAHFFARPPPSHVPGREPHPDDRLCIPRVPSPSRA